MKKLRLAVTTLAWHGHGGIERCVQAECAWLGARGHEVHVFAASFEGPAPQGVHFHRVPVPAKPWVLRLTAFALRSAAMVAQAGPFDVVHAHTAYAGRGHIAHAHSVHRKAIAFDRPPGLFAGLRWWLKGLPPWVLRLSDRSYRQAVLCVAISRVIQAELRDAYALPAAQNFLLYYGVQSEHFRPLTALRRKALRRQLGMDDGVWAVFCGWNWRRKGLDVLFDALKKAEGVKLAVVGEDVAEGAEFKALAAKLGLAGRVRFVGRQKDPRPWFQAGDIFAFPTRYEPFGMVVSEAMACGLPVLIPRQAGAAEVVAARRDLQILAEAEDGKGLARGLCAMRDKPALRRSLGAANRRASAAMRWSRHCLRLEKLYTSLAGKRA